VPETITTQQIEGRVIDALVEFGEEAESVSLDARLDELEIDSLDLVELAQIVEDEYGVELKDSDLDQVKTVSDVVELIAQRA
jgi:acyl carrier protein